MNLDRKALDPLPSPPVPKYGPDGALRAVPLVHSFSFFQGLHQSHATFWALISYYVPQMNIYACSVATLAILLNAARVHLDMNPAERIVTQEMLLDQVDIQNWNQRVSPGGFQGKYGVTLEQFAEITLCCFRQFGFPNVQVEAVHIEDASEKNQNRLAQALLEKSDREFFVANFDHKILAGSGGGGHFSPIGAYDPELRRVLILDTYRFVYEPYWISLETLVEGMMGHDKESDTSRGFLRVVHG